MVEVKFTSADGELGEIKQYLGRSRLTNNIFKSIKHDMYWLVIARWYKFPVTIDITTDNSKLSLRVFKIEFDDTSVVILDYNGKCIRGFVMN